MTTPAFDMEAAYAYLKRKAIRATPVRAGVLCTLMQEKPQCKSAKAVFASVSHILQAVGAGAVSMATVYRALKDLTESGELIQTASANGAMLYGLWPENSEKPSTSGPLNTPALICQSGAEIALIKNVALYQALQKALELAGFHNVSSLHIMVEP